MVEGFAAFILSHGRPDNVKTYRTLRRSGYTGPIFVIADDEDKTLPAYREAFGSELIVFSKRDIAARFDEADNFGDRRSVFYARNACFEIAQRLGFRDFIQLDDDYEAFSFRSGARQEYGTWNITCLDEVFGLVRDFFRSIPAASVCFCQGGDFIGGEGNSYVRDVVTFKRKAMNTFMCSTDRPFRFVGRVNEDVNTYVDGGRRGLLFLTLMGLQIVQTETQGSAGGMTDIYLNAGTFLKSFYSVMFAPSCVSIADMGELHRRIHHRVEWRNAVPAIVRESVKKERIHA